MDSSDTIKFLTIDIYSLASNCSVSDIFERGIRYSAEGQPDWEQLCEQCADILENHGISEFLFCTYGEIFAEHYLKVIIFKTKEYGDCIVRASKACIKLTTVDIVDIVDGKLITGAVLQTFRYTDANIPYWNEILEFGDRYCEHLCDLKYDLKGKNTYLPIGSYNQSARAWTPLRIETDGHLYELRFRYVQRGSIRGASLEIGTD